MATVLVHEITKNGNWIVFHKTISQHIGLIETILLMEHVNISDHFQDKYGWYYRTRTKLCDVLHITKNTCIKYEKKLVELGLLICKKQSSMTMANQYKINVEKVLELASTGGAKNEPQGVQILHPNENKLNRTISSDDTSYHPRGVEKEPTPQSAENCDKNDTVVTPKIDRSVFKNVGANGNPRDIQKKKCVQMHPATKELLLYWNSLANTTKHKIEYEGDEVAPLHKQTKLIQACNIIIKKVIRGTFYKDYTDISENHYKTLKPQVLTIKVAMKRLNDSLTPEHTRHVKVYKPSICNFFINKNLKVDNSKGRNKYFFRYPFLFYIGNEVAKVADSHVEVTTKHPLLLSKLIQEFRANGVNNITHNRYNEVVKATNLIDEMVSKRLQTPQRIRSVMQSIHVMVFNAMRNSYGDIKLEYLYKTCKYKLEDYLVQKRYL